MQRMLRRLQRLREHHQRCSERYEEEVKQENDREHKRTLQLIEVMDRQKKPQDELCFEGSSKIFKSAQDSDEEPDIFTQEISITQPSNKCKRIAKKGSSKEKIPKRVLKSPKDSDGKRSKEPAQDSDEEADILSQRTSTPRSTKKLKKMEKTRSFKKKCLKKNFEPAQDSDEGPEVLAEVTNRDD